MALTGSEPIIALVKARLVDELNGVIDAVNAAVTDGVTISYPAQILDFVPPPTLLTGFPTIGIQEGTLTLEDDTEWGATGVLPITIVFYIQSADPQAMAKQLRRYERAVMTCILRGRQLPPEVWGMKFLRSDPGPTLGNQENPREYMSLRAVTIEVKFEQDTP